MIGSKWIGLGGVAVAVLSSQALAQQPYTPSYSLSRSYSQSGQPGEITLNAAAAGNVPVVYKNGRYVPVAEANAPRPRAAQPSPSLRSDQPSRGTSATSRVGAAATRSSASTPPVVPGVTVEEPELPATGNFPVVYENGRYIPEAAADPAGRPARNPNINTRVTVSGAYRNLGGIHFVTPGFSKARDLPGLRNPISGAGTGAGLEDRSYGTNGFVFVGATTKTNGLTGNWGYRDRDSQISGGVLTLTGDMVMTERTIDPSQTDKSWSENADGGSPYLTWEYLVPVGRNFRVGPQAGFMYLPLSGSKQSTTFRAVATDSDTLVSVSDQYNVSSFPGTLPVSFTGSFGNTNTIPYADPVPRTYLSTNAGPTRAGEAWNEIREDFNGDLYTFSIGPVGEFESGDFFANTSLGLAVNLLDFRARYSEKLLFDNPEGGTERVREWTEERDSTSVLFGFFAQALIGWRLSEHWSVSGFFRYDINEDFTGDIGPSSFDVNLTGFSAGGGFSFSF